MQHSSLIGGSTAARRINCPASYALSEMMPKSGKVSSYAMEGTALHECADRAVSQDLEPQSFLGQTIEGVKITQDMIDDKLTPALTALEEIFDEYKIHEYDSEQEVHFTNPVLDGCFGTTDVIARNSDSVFILDYKFGDGVMVSPENNSQLMFYALAASQDPKTADLFEGAKFVYLGIIQPSFNNPDTYGLWYTRVDALKKFEAQLETTIGAIKGMKDLEPCAGSWCKFCPAEAICPAKSGLAQHALRIDTTEGGTDALEEALNIVDEVEAWAKAVRKLAHEQLEAGVQLKDWKLVAKRATRKWANPAELEDKIRKMRRIKIEEASDLSFHTPAKLEKLCKQKDIDFEKTFGSMVEAVSTGTTLAPATDKRPEVLPIASLAGLAKAINN